MAAMLKAAAVVLTVALSLGLGACQREQKGISEDLPAARATRARADAQAIASAVRQYQTMVGSLPDSLEALTQPQTTSGGPAGPFLARIPEPPAGWSPYQYAKQGEANFTI